MDLDLQYVRERNSICCYFTALNKGRVKMLLPGKQNNDLWNLCVCVCFVSRWRQCLLFSSRATLHVLTFITARSIFFAPPLRCLTFAYFHLHTCSAHTDTHTHNISVVAMVTLSEAPRFPDKASLSRTLFCVSSKTRADRRSADVSVTVEPTLCVSSKAVHECICAVWGFLCVCLCVCHWLGTGMPDRMSGENSTESQCEKHILRCL